MAAISGYACDVCGVTRQPSNHWFLGVTKDDQFTITPWGDSTACDDRVKHICGIGCASKLLSTTVEGWR